MSETLLQATNIHKKYGSLQVLKGIDLSIAKGEVVSIVGASGAGKSTLLHILGTLDNADTGEVHFSGQELTKMNNTDLARFRNRYIGFIFQFHNLLPGHRIIGNVAPGPSPGS